MKTKITLISIVIAQLAGFIGSIFTSSSVDSWYLTLKLPILNPPAWIFGPVWLTLYTMMGIAAAIIYENKSTKGRNMALCAYSIQLLLNSAWSIIFFGLKNPGMAFAEIVVLLATILLTTVLFWKNVKVAGLLMLPYLMWVTFATYLNYSIWMLNN